MSHSDLEADIEEDGEDGKPAQNNEESAACQAEPALGLQSHADSN